MGRQLAGFLGGLLKDLASTVEQMDFGSVAATIGRGLTHGDLDKVIKDINSGAATPESLIEDFGGGEDMATLINGANSYTAATIETATRKAESIDVYDVWREAQNFDGNLEHLAEDTLSTLNNAVSDGDFAGTILRKLVESQLGFEVDGDVTKMTKTLERYLRSASKPQKTFEDILLTPSVSQEEEEASMENGQCLPPLSRST